MRPCSPFGFTLRDRSRTALTRSGEEGDSTIEIVFWAVGLLALAGLVYAAILALVNSKIQGIAAAQA